MVITKPTVKRPGLGKPVPVAGLPRTQTALAVKYQQVFHLNPENLVAYDAMTYPSLQARWQTQAQRGELLGVSASVAGEMVGFAVAEQIMQSDAEQSAELISWYVLPAYRLQGIGVGLVKHLQRLVGRALVSTAN